MERRAFLKRAGAGMAATALAAPGDRADRRAVRWRLATSWPKSLDAMYGAVEAMCKRVAQLTERNSRFSRLPAARSCRRCRCWTRRKTARSSAATRSPRSISARTRPMPSIPASLSASTPASRTPGCITAAASSSCATSSRRAASCRFPAATSACRWAASIARRSTRVDDLKGLKFRIGGLGGTVLAKLGVVPQQIATADIYPSLEKRHDRCGRMDRSLRRREARSPQGRQVLLLSRAGGKAAPMVTLIVNAQAWEALPRALQGGARGRMQRADPADDGEVRREEPRGVAAAGRPPACSCGSFRVRCWTPATRRRSRPTTSWPPRTPTSSRSTNPGKSSWRIRTSGSGSPRTISTITATRCPPQPR